MNNDHYQLSYSVGVAENTNKTYRPSMEDVHTYVENFVERLDWGYFAIFDGHAGQQAAKWCGQNLHTLIEKRLIENDMSDVREILNDCFVDADYEIVKNCKGTSGCTAAVAVIRWEVPDDEDDAITKQPSNAIEDISITLQHSDTIDDEFKNNIPEVVDPKIHKRVLYTANVGDTRIILFRDGKAIRLTYDHTASDKFEVQRIKSKGGIIMKSRVNGMLAVTRSLGDQFFKDLVIGNPYTCSVELESTTDRFLIIACDGLWDVISDQDACELISEETDANAAAKKLVEYALSHSTTDNVTAMVVILH